jgi:hypothetical protein
MDPIACTLEDYSRGARRERWVTLASRALVEIETTDGGLRLVLAADESVEHELRELADLERECCAFATWSVERVGDRLVLDVAARRDDAVPAVQGMFVPLRELLPTA